MSNKKKKYSQNNKPQAVETNSTTASSTAPAAEFNSYSTSQSLSYYYFGLDILELYDAKQLMAMIRDPMGHNKELREIARMLYNTNGTYTHTVDYLTAMLTLDKVISTSGKSKSKKKKNQEAMNSTLKMINAEINMYPAAKAQTDISESLEDRSTLPIIAKLLEYRMALNTRITRIALSIRNTRNTLNPLFTSVNDGRMDSKSITAMGESGYLIKDQASCLSNL